jgi:hypothetical protein
LSSSTTSSNPTPTIRTPKGKGNNTSIFKSPIATSPESVGSDGLTPPPSNRGSPFPDSGLLSPQQSREAKHAKLKFTSIQDPYCLIGWQINVNSSGVGVIKSLDRRLMRTTRFEVLYPSSGKTEMVKLKRGPKGYVDYELIQKLNV